ncbi:MAG: hypothetical protein WC565_02925 [Parcubacteria group bacterium]
MPIDPALQALIDADPIYQQAIANAQAQAIADKTSRDTAMRRSLIDFGQTLDPAAIAAQLGITAADAAEIMNAQTNQLAQANTAAGTSMAAQLQKAYRDAQRGLVNALASRGMLRSGDTGYGLQKEGLADVQRQYAARRQLLDYLTGSQSGYTEAERARQLALAQALSEAYTRVLQQYPNGVDPPGPYDGGGGDEMPDDGNPSDPGAPPIPGPQDPTHPPPPTPPPPMPEPPPGGPSGPQDPTHPRGPVRRDTGPDSRRPRGAGTLQTLLDTLGNPSYRYITF